jgi:hypothetical protein
MRIGVLFFTLAFSGTQFWAISSQAGSSGEANPSVSQTTDMSSGNFQVQLQIIRDGAKTMALQIIASYDPASPEYEKAKKLYTTAQIKFNSFTSVMLLNYTVGNKIDLKASAKEAVDSYRTFSDYVNSLNPETKGVIGIAPVIDALLKIADKAWDLFEKYRKGEHDRRQALADGLKPLITWTEWNKLTSS